MTRIIPLYPNKPIKPSPSSIPSSDLIRLKEILYRDFTAVLAKSLQEIIGPTPKKWLSPKEVCHKLNISRRALQRLREEDGLPYAVIGGEVYFDPRDIEKELRRRKRTMSLKPRLR